MLKSPAYKIFFKYTIPTIIGFLSISSASVIDGYFIGNYTGSIGLAAVNISYPIMTVLFGLTFTFAVGSSVMVGALMGQGQKKEASNVFTKSVISASLISTVLCIFLLGVVGTILNLLDVSGELKEKTLVYLSVLLHFFPFFMTGFVMNYFVRVDQHPNLSSFALLMSSIVNIGFDYLFIVKLNYGIRGAAYATGLCYMSIFCLMLPNFLRKKSSFGFVKPQGSWICVINAAKNGVSEFVNESSIGVTILIFNFIMLKNFGHSGVASYTIIGYFIMASSMISFAVSDGLQPVISTNFGASNYRRIKKFLKLGFISILCIEISLTLVVVVFPDSIINIFLNKSEFQTKKISVEFISYTWPAFVFAGLNILITSYLTSIQKPFYSFITAILRSLLLPVLFIIILPFIFGNSGIFAAISVSEFITFLIAANIFMKNIR
ncbi:MAG: MATE family efflux transporter [Deltaproteobacteria bacterium]|nr:MAG: MATE family efflux transporter [Deltaproteobacteria bacterium]